MTRNRKLIEEWKTQQQKKANENVQVQRSYGDSVREDAGNREGWKIYFMAHLGVQGKGEA